VKYGGANMMWMASTVMVPMSNIVFSFPFLPTHQVVAYGRRRHVDVELIVSVT
jgi:hypothetical protein